MAGLSIKGVVFDMYGTLVDVGAVAEACKEMAPEPVAPMQTACSEYQAA